MVALIISLLSFSLSVSIPLVLPLFKTTIFKSQSHKKCSVWFFFNTLCFYLFSILDICSKLACLYVEPTLEFSCLVDGNDHGTSQFFSELEATDRFRHWRNTGFFHFSFYDFKKDQDLALKPR